MKSPDILAHQKSALNIIIERIKNGDKRSQIVMAPGTGKSQVILGIIGELKEISSHFSRKVLLITSSSELQSQLLASLKESQNEFMVSSDFDGRHSDQPTVSVCTVQSLSNHNNRSATRETEKRPDVVISLDINPESSSLKTILSAYPDAVQIAFVNYAQESEWIGGPVWQYTLADAIKDKVLKPFTIKQIRFSDFQNSSDNIHFPNDQQHLESAAETFLKENNNQKAIVYCQSVDFAKRFADELNKTKTDLAIFVDSKIHFGERRRLIKNYETNERPLILCTASVLGELNNLALTKNIAIFRKTESVIELQGMLTPSLLPFQGKEKATVFDFAGLEDLFKSLKMDYDVEKAKVEERYFQKADINFRDKKEIEGVLGVNELADELAEIITRMPVEQGSMIGIFGKWGRGKTFLIDQTWKKLKTQKRFIKVDYHAWKYQDTPATWAYLYECLAESYFNPEVDNKLAKWVIGIWRIFWLNIQRKGVKPLLKFAAIISAGIMVKILATALFSQLNNEIEILLNRVGSSLVFCATAYALLVSVKKEYSAKAKDLFLKYSTKHSFKEHLGVQAEIQKETLTLMTTWIPKKKMADRKVVLFVEDIDRCHEIKIIQIIDSLRVLLEDPEIAERIVVVTAVDERMLKLAIKMKYHALVSLDKAAEDKDNENRKALNKMVNEYIDKLFIAGLKLGNLSLLESDEFFLALTKADRTEEKTDTLTEVLAKDGNLEYGRYSQQIRSNDLDQSIIDAELDGYNDDYYEEPDFATMILESSKPLTQSNGDNNAEKNSLLNKLSIDELNILRVSIAKYKGVTPRQIRVFYYRYLIAKNLLIRRYHKLNRTSVWQTSLNCRILATLIVIYTVNEDHDILEKHLLASIANQQEIQKVELMVETVINGFDYQELLKVLSIVIAY